MEVALSEPLRRGTPLPLSQLVEDSRSRASVPHHLLESKIHAKLRSNSQIQAEPPELHFSGFKLGESYVKILKLINISSEVVNIHIIPTLTKYFQTTYTKKYRLIPGLAYSVKVGFCPDEWRYFYDCIRVHCKGEENLLIPVHAYPVIDDLHIPPRIDLSAVPLGQSVCHAVPLRCSCPIDFEFEVFVVQPHEAFTIHPLTGVIPASGEAMIAVTFSPVQYETAQFTFQLIVSQFNTKPYLCTVTGSSAPNLALSWPERKTSHRDGGPAEYRGPQPAAQVLPRSKTRSTKEADQLKTLRDQGDVKHGLTPSLDVCTPAGVAKMLIKDINKLCSKDLQQALSCSSLTARQSREMKEALFIKKVQAVREQQANHMKCKVHLGLVPMSKQSMVQIMEERETALHEYMVKRGDLRQDEDFSSDCTRLSSRRMPHDAGQAPEGAPTFQFYTGSQWELKHKAIRLFQQATCKVVIRSRMKQRLACLKKLADNMKTFPSTQKAEEEKKNELKISPDKIFPPSLPIFSNEDDPLALSNLMMVPADPVDVTVTTHIPFFKLQVPQHYKLMGFQPVSAWEAFNSCLPTTLARPLRTAAPDILVPPEDGVQFVRRVEPKAEEAETVTLSFKAPEALLRPFPANTLQIFNPAPGLQTFKPEPKYLESDLEFHLCPLPRYTLPVSNRKDSKTQTPHTQKTFLHHKKAIAGVMKWKDFDSIFLNRLSNLPSVSSDCTPRRSVDYNTDILPLTAPPPPATLLLETPLMDTQCEGSEIRRTPEMIRAEFLSGKALVSNSNLAAGVTARHQREMEVTHRSGISQMGKRVMTRLKQLGSSHSPGEDSE